MTDSTANRARPRPVTETSAGRLLGDAATILEPRGYAPDLNKIMWRRKLLKESPASVVVVGELSAGKSSIVNALLGDPELAPVGAKECTRVSLRFIPPTDDLPAGTIRLDLDGDSREIIRGALTDWVTVSGAYADTPEADRILAVDIGHNSTELPGVTVIDTPGSGGLSKSHARRALTSAGGAGILLIITESDGRITKSTLDFLAQAAGFAGWIIIAMNKIDQNRSWQQILDENAAMLMKQKFPPAAFVGVSALWARKALTEQTDREGLRSISRIDDLIAALKVPLDHASWIPEINAVTQLAKLIERAAADQALALAMIAEPDAAKKQLEKQQAELDEIREGQRHWRNRINKGVQALRTDATMQTRKLLREFEEEWHEKAQSIFGKSKPEATALQQEMADAVKDIEVSIVDLLAVGTERVIKELFAAAHLQIPEELDMGVDFESAEKPSLRTVFESGGKVGLIAGGLSMGVMIARPGMVASSALGAIGPIVALPVIAVGVLGGFMLSKRIKNSRELQQRITDHSRVIREGLADAISQAAAHLTLVVSEAFEDAVRDAQRDIDSKITDAKKALTESAKKRSLRKADHEAAMESFLTLNRKALAEARRLRGNLGPLSRL